MVEVVRRRDVDDVDLGVGDEVGVRAVRPAMLGPVRELLRRRDRARPDGDDLLARVAAQGTGEPLGDPAGAQHAPPQGGRGHRIGQAGGRERAGKRHLLHLRHAPSGVHRRDDRLGHGARGHAVPARRERGRCTGEHGVDPGLQLDPVGVGEPRAPVGGIADPVSLSRVEPHPGGLGQADRPGLADDLAADVVAVAGVQERLAGAQHAVSGPQVDQLRVLQPLVDLRRAARRHPGHLDDRGTQQPRHDVELVDRGAGDRELRGGVRGTAHAPADVVHQHRRADRPVVDRLAQLHVAGVEPAHEAQRQQRLAGGTDVAQHLPALGERGRQRLLAQHRLAGLHRRDDLLGVHGVVRGDDDGVHGRVRDQRERVVVGAGPPPRRRPRPGRGPHRRSR